MAGLDPNRWQAIGPYLEEVLDIVDDGARAVWLAALSEREPEVAADLRVLLDEHRALARERFLEGKAAAHPGMAAGQSVGAYTLVSLIGHGGMGTVWLAERSDGRFNRRAAVKFLSASFSARGQERFRREGRILARLVHPHIAQLVDAGVGPSGQPYLVLEFVDGEPIDQYCNRHDLGVATRVELMLDVLGAVAHAHANLIVHRDLKPSNVLVDGDGQVKLLDFGIAKLLEEDGQDATRFTRDGGQAMTPAYAAPEQMTGGPVTTATDVYALGVLAFTLLTGQHPGGATATTSPADLMKAIVETDSRRPSEVCPDSHRRLLRGDLDTIVGKALKKNPGDRYASVLRLADDLRRYLRHEPISARADSLMYRTTRFVRRNRLAVALAATAVVAATAGVIGIVFQARTARLERDFALRELKRAEAVNDLNTFVLSDAAPSGRLFKVDDLLARAEHIVTRQQGNAGQRVELLISIGRQYTALDEYAKARRLLEEAYTESRALTEPSTRSGASCALAQTLANTGEMPRAEVLLQEGLDALPNQPTFVLDRIFCLERGSEIAVRRGAGQDAIARAAAAERLVAIAPVKSELSELGALLSLASAYSNAGRHREASQAFELAWTRLTVLGRDDTTRAATILNNWGVSLSVSGRPLDAARQFERAIAISRDSEQEDGLSPMLLLNYARVLQDVGRVPEAAGYVERAYEKAKAMGAEVVVSQAATVRAAVARSQGDVVRAFTILADAEPWLRRNLPAGHIAFGSLASQRALTAEARGDLPAAFAFANDSVVIADAAFAARRQGADFVSVFLTRRSEIELRLGHTTEAAADAERAVAASTADLGPTVLTSIAGRAYLALGRAREAEGQHDAAVDALRKAVGHLEDALGADAAEARDAHHLLEISTRRG